MFKSSEKVKRRLKAAWEKTIDNLKDIGKALLKIFAVIVALVVAIVLLRSAGWYFVPILGVVCLFAWNYYEVGR